MERTFIVAITTGDNWEMVQGHYLVKADSEMEARAEVEKWIPGHLKVLEVKEYLGGVKLINEPCVV